MMNEVAISQMMRKGMRSIFFMLPALACVLSACDAHDYWFLSDVIKVSSDEDVLSASNQESIAQDLFVRYELDYELQNLSNDQDTEVVVSATSYVNGVKRETGQKVYHLDAGQSVQGILTSSQLELGNSIVVSLSCCATSQCSRKDVICSEQEEKSDIKTIVSFCDNACQYDETCVEQCPDEEVCQDLCNGISDDISYASCRNLLCVAGSGMVTCSSKCNGDEACLETCTPVAECESKCIQKTAGCFMNCIATWTQCEDDRYLPESSPIPCTLCGRDGLCKANFDVPVNDNLFLYSESGVKYACSVDCSAYPDVCVTDCANNYSNDDDRINCMYTCLQQHLFWCNDYSIPYDYVDLQYKQPCCFSDYCNNDLIGVVKTFDVECYFDSDCKSGSYCSSEGLCESSGASGCAINPRKQSFPVMILLALFAGIIIRRRHYA